MKNLALLVLAVLALGAAACRSARPLAGPDYDANAIRQRANNASGDLDAESK